MDLRCMNESERENDGKAVKFKPFNKCLLIRDNLIVMVFALILQSFYRTNKKHLQAIIVADHSILPTSTTGCFSSRCIFLKFSFSWLSLCSVFIGGSVVTRGTSCIFLFFHSSSYVLYETFHQDWSKSSLCMMCDIRAILQTHTHNQCRTWKWSISSFVLIGFTWNYAHPPTTLPQLQVAKIRFSLNIKWPYSSPVVACRSACPWDTWSGPCCKPQWW